MPQQFWSVGLAPYASLSDATSRIDTTTTRCIRTRASRKSIGGKVWDTLSGQRFYEDGVPIRISSNFLVDGDNQIRLAGSR